MKKAIFSIVALSVLTSAIAGVELTHASVAYVVEEKMADMKDDIKTTLNIEVNLEEHSDRQGITYKPEGFLAYIHLTASLTELATRDDADQATREALSSYYRTWFANEGFEKYGNMYDGESYIKYFDNNSTDKEIIVCEIDYRGLACSTVFSRSGVESGYVLENKAIVNKLAMAYEAAGHDSSNLIIGGSLTTLEDKIAESKEYEGYATISTGISHRDGIGGAMGLWYRTDKNGEWKFFTATQAVLLCSDFNTEDLQKAYSGMICDTGAGENSEVKFIDNEINVPDTGFNTKNLDTVNILKITLIAAPTIAIIGYITTYICKRLSRSVKFTKK